MCSDVATFVPILNPFRIHSNDLKKNAKTFFVHIFVTSVMASLFSSGLSVCCGQRVIAGFMFESLLCFAVATVSWSEFEISFYYYQIKPFSTLTFLLNPVKISILLIKFDMFLLLKNK